MNLQAQMTIYQSPTLAKRIVVQPLGNMAGPNQVMVAFVNDDRFQWYLFDQSNNFRSFIDFGLQPRSITPSDPQNLLLNELGHQVIYAERGSSQIMVLKSGSLQRYSFSQQAFGLGSIGNTLGMFLFPSKVGLDPNTSGTWLERSLFLFFQNKIFQENANGELMYYSDTTTTGFFEENAQNFAYNPLSGQGLYRIDSQIGRFHITVTLEGASNGVIELDPRLENKLSFLTMLTTDKLIFYTNKKYVIVDRTSLDEEFSFFHENILVFLREVYEGSTSYCQFAMILPYQNSPTVVKIYSIPTKNLSQLQ